MKTSKEVCCRDDFFGSRPVQNFNCKNDLKGKPLWKSTRRPPWMSSASIFNELAFSMFANVFCFVFFRWIVSYTQCMENGC